MTLEIFLLCFLLCPIGIIFALFTALDRGAPPTLRRPKPPAPRKSQRPLVRTSPASVSPMF